MAAGKILIDIINDRPRSSDALSFWWLGQASVIVKIAGKIIYIDPYLSEDSKRKMPPLLNPSEVTNADFILCSHDHGDHLDRNSIAHIAVASPQAVFLVPATAVTAVMESGVDAKRIIALNAEQNYQTADITFSAIKAKHEFFDQTQQGAFPYLGYIIKSGKLGIYHAGDTLIYDGLVKSLLKFEKLTVAFLPINGRDGRRYRMGCSGNMTYQEAVDMAGELKPRLVVPIHYNMFEFNTEDPQLFVDYLKAKYPETDHCIPLPGEAVDVRISSRETSKI